MRTTLSSFLRAFAVAAMAASPMISLFGDMQPYTVRDYSHLLKMSDFNTPLLKMHLKLYEGYVKNANDLLTKLKAMSEANQANSYEYGALKRRLGWEFDGMRLHELYFENLGGKGSLDSNNSLFSAIVSQFGSFDNWKKDFIATGLIRGVGWAILYLDRTEGRLVNTWINEHDVGHLAGGIPILVMDVFEHAYIPQFGLDRSKYIEAFFKNIDWKSPQSRFEQESPE